MTTLFDMPIFWRRSVVIKIAPQSRKEGLLWGDYYYAVSLKKYLENGGWRVKILFSSKWDSFLSNFTYPYSIFLRGICPSHLKNNQINIMWNISHPNDVTMKEYGLFDVVGVASSHWADKVEKKLETNAIIHPLLQATDHKIFSPYRGENNKYKSEILFVGNSRNVYRKSVKYAIEGNYNLTLYGSNWEQFIDSKFVKGKNIANSELYRYYSSAKVVLNDHWDDMVKKGFVSNRIYDALACEAVILTDGVVDMDPKIKKFLTVYSNQNDFDSKLKDILINNNKYKEKAKGARKYIIEKYSFERRVKEIILLIEKHVKMKEK